MSDGCWIRDEGANNGTFVEGERIRRRRLETGIFVRLGEVEFRFESDVPRLRSTEETSRKVAMTRRHDVGFDAGGDAQILPDGPACSLVFALAGSVWGGFG